MMTPDEPYNEFSICKKCGAGSYAIATKHVTAYDGLYEAIRRTCGRCDFRWDQKPVTTAAEREPQIAA